MMIAGIEKPPCEDAFDNNQQTEITPKERLS
jgi:hypothetical protein